MKKLIALITGIALVFSLVACGSKAPSAAPSKDTTESIVTPAGQLPVVPEGTDITLTVGVIGGPFIADHATNYFIKWVEENTGVKLEFTVYPQDTIIEKMLLELSAGNADALPDIYLARQLVVDTIFMPSYAPRWFNEGMIIPMNDLIEEYGVNYKLTRDIAQDQGYDVEKWITSADGNIYTLPGFTASLTNSYPHKMWINQGWLDALDLEMPTTTEQFQDVLQAFKDNDPNGNGQKDEIPFSGAKRHLYYAYDVILNSFIYNQSDFSRVYVENSKLEFAPIKDEWRDALIYLRGLADKGLYYDGSFTQDITTLQQMALNENDILGAFEGLGHDLVLTTTDQNILDRWAAVPALTGPDGAHYTTWKAPSIWANSTITAGCDYPEVAFRVLDFMMSPEGTLITRYGEQGVNWEYADEGAISYYGTPAIVKILENTHAVAGQNQTFMQQSPFIMDPAIAKGVQWDGNEDEAGYVKARAVMLLDETAIVPDEFIANLVFTLEELEMVTTARTNIDSYIQETIASFTSGDWNPSDDAQWESYKAEFEKMGLNEFLATAQDAYDRQKAA